MTKPCRSVVLGVLIAVLLPLPVWAVTDLSQGLLGEDPLTIIELLREAIRQGARPDQLSLALAYASAVRIARFGSANNEEIWQRVRGHFRIQ